jgi:transposase
MAYDEKYKRTVVEYRNEGHSLESTSKIFKVSESAIKVWVKQLKEKGHLEKKELNRTFKKIDPEELKKAVSQTPDALLRELAEQFNCSKMAIKTALDKLKITRKKKDKIQGAGSK